MARRTTKADLERVVVVIRRMTGDDTYGIGYAYGQPRLERADGSRGVSPRLPSGELRRWMGAYLDGIMVGQRTENRSDA